MGQLLQPPPSPGPQPQPQPQQQPAPMPQTTSMPQTGPGATPAPAPGPGTPQPGPEQTPQQGPQYEPQQLPVPQNELIDPFYQSQLGQWLRGLSSGWDRSPYGPGTSTGQYIPGSSVSMMPTGGGQQGQQQPGGFDLQGLLQGIFGGGQAQPFQTQTPGQYLPPVGPTEWMHRSGMTNQMMNAMPNQPYGRAIPSTGPYSPGSQAIYMAQTQNQRRYGRGTGSSGRTIPAMAPERWDPGQGIYWWM